MIAELTSLASFRLVSVRRAALLHLQARQDTIEMIHCAEAVAGHRLPLDWQRIISENVDTIAVSDGDYLSVLSIKDKARASNEKLLSDAKGQMSQVRNEWKALVMRLEENIVKKENEKRARGITANEKLDASKAEASQLVDYGELPSMIPDLLANPEWGCFFGLCICCIGTVLMIVLWSIDGHPRANALGKSMNSPLLPVISLLLGLFGPNIISQIILRRKCRSEQRQRAAKARLLLAEANRVYREEFGVIEGPLTNQVTIWGNELKDADALFKKAQEAVAMILAHDTKDLG